MDNGEGLRGRIVLDLHDPASVPGYDQALVELEVARLSRGGRRLASCLVKRIAEIEAEWGAEAAEAVVEGVIEILRGRRRVLS